MTKEQRIRRRKKIRPIGPTWFKTGSRFTEFCKRLNDKTKSVDYKNSKGENNQSVHIGLHETVEREIDAASVVVQSVQK